MFPLGDVIPSRTTPWVTYGLIGAAAILFAANRLSIGWASSATLVVLAPLLHHGWLTFIANVISLWVFGDNVEDRFGHGRFLIFYLVAAAAAGAGQVIWCGAATPTVAASGAVAAVMAAYFVMFPYSRVLVGVFLIFLVDVIELPALFVVLFWAIFTFGAPVHDVVPGAGAGGLCALGVGVLTGVVGAWTLKRPERQRVDWWS